MISDKIRFAVMGCGHIGMRHAAFITANEECELVGLCDTRPAKELGLEKTGAPFFQREDDLLGLDFDVLSVATPNGLHEHHAIKALSSGHHVLIEKPMALSGKSCANIILEAQKQGRHVFCVMQNRYSAPSVWLKDLLEKNKLGEIFLVTIHCFWNRDERYYREGSWKGTRDLDGGTLFTQFSHFIDSLLWLFGDIEGIESRFRNFSHSTNTEFEDSGIVSFNFKKGGMGCFNFTTAVRQENLESSLTIIAEKGTVKISGQYMDEVQICNIEEYTMPILPKTLYMSGGNSHKGPAANHAYVFRNVVNVLKRGKLSEIDPREACKVVETIEKIYKTVL
ncbi:MAG TPA: Gfo/Idh/MocA family oxidoreductase [Puia sp.]